jgi:hypothetical protein
MLLAASLAGCSHPPSAPAVQTQTDEGITVMMSVSPGPPNTGPPHSGDDTIHLLVINAANDRPVDDANVTVSADMTAPRLAGQDVSGRSQGVGHYDAPVTLGVATKYDIHVRVQRARQSPADFVFPIEAWQ